MAATTITATLVDGTTTVVVSKPDYPTAQDFIQNLPKQGGFWADNGNFIPYSGVMKFVLT